MEGSFPINEEARRLFQSLLARAAAGKFDEAFLIALVRYHKTFPESERYEALYARYALAQNAPLVALEYGDKASRRRPFSSAIWRLMADIYRALGRNAEAERFSEWLVRWERKADVAALRREIEADIAGEKILPGIAVAEKRAGVGQKAAGGEDVPASPGAKERRYEIEVSAIPDEPLRLWIRTKSHEFRWETKTHVVFDGRVDRSRFSYQLYTREETPRAVRDAALEHRFLSIVECHTRAMAENGEFWPEEKRGEPYEPTKGGLWRGKERDR